MQPLRTIKEIDSYIKNCWICGKYIPLSYHSNRLDDITSATISYAKNTDYYSGGNKISAFIIRDTGFVLKEANKTLHKKCKTCNISISFRVGYYNEDKQNTCNPMYYLSNVNVGYISKGNTIMCISIHCVIDSENDVTYYINVNGKTITYDMDFSKVKKIKEIVDKVNLYSILE